MMTRRREILRMIPQLMAMGEVVTRTTMMMMTEMKTMMTRMMMKMRKRRKKMTNLLQRRGSECNFSFY